MMLGMLRFGWLSSILFLALVYLSRSTTHIDLAGDGGGDEGGPAFLEQVDGALGFGGEGGKRRSSRGPKARTKPAQGNTLGWNGKNKRAL
jgi:hypothetical protein